jgi:Domain of unknown function (DUF4149)
MNGSRVVQLVAASFGLLATGVWLGGLLVLGAIVAPVVFREVPAPASADAMTIVFVRFDKLAMLSAAIVAVAEAVRTRAVTAPVAKPESKVDALRLAVIGVAGALAVIQGMWLSPTIVGLHREGAIRGLGPLGERLERFHAWSETCGKTESLLLVALIVLLVDALRVSAGTDAAARRGAA